MKTYKTLLLLLITALFTLGCTEDTFDHLSSKEGDFVELTLPYHTLSRIPVNLSRAGETERINELKELQVFIFDSNKRLKGYKFLPQDVLNQNGERGNINIKTRTGESYIYAVANIGRTYSPPYSAVSVNDKMIPTNADEAWNESDIQAFGKDFTIDDLKNIAFEREGNNINITDFMMSGSANNGQPCIISENIQGTGYISSPENTDNQLIKLRRITSRVDFTIKDGTKAGVTHHFTPSKYEIYNISNKGSILADGHIGANDGTFTNLLNGLFTPNTPNSFSVYLPENVQTDQVKNAVTLRAFDTAKGKQQREAYDRTNPDDPKTFTYAPTNGTYVLLKGLYEELKNGEITRTANTSYTIHLGDFNKDVADFNVDRNCYYKYTVTINGVDEIVTEVEKDDDNQPGAEGIVFDYDKGTPYILDAHYEQCNMTFYKKDLDELLNIGKGYFYQVEDLGKKSDIVYIDIDGKLKRPDGTPGSMNGVDDSWIEFATAKGADKAFNTNTGKNPDGTVKTYNVREFFKYLYNNQNTNNFWSGRGDSRYVTFTCYIKENYHEGLSWDKFVNKSPRTFYIANDVKKSSDGRSIHATAQYSVSQYAIQTFYNQERSNILNAYGLESIREEEKLTGITGSKEATGTDKWNGRANTINQNGSDNWEKINKNIKDLRYACMARNRDLNGNGTIDKNEVRWYCPSVEQYAGIWLGEAALDKNARLFQNKTSDLYVESGSRKNQEHYYSSTKGTRVIWSEEGFATGDGTDAKYVRCIRTLEKNGGLGLLDADKYYKFLTIDGKQNAGYDIEDISPDGLRNSDELHLEELPQHTERITAGSVSTDWNRPASKLQFSQTCISTFSNRTFTLADVIEGRANCSQYHEVPGDKWRVPNQRELSLLYILNMHNNKSGALTSFSNPNIRYGWMISDTYNNNGTKIGDIIRMLTKSEAESTTVVIRCVRDVR